MANFDPSKHPRVPPGGPNGGQFTAGQISSAVRADAAKHGGLARITSSSAWTFTTHYKDGTKNSFAFNRGDMVPGTGFDPMAKMLASIGAEHGASVKSSVVQMGRESLFSRAPLSRAADRSAQSVILNIDAAHSVGARAARTMKSESAAATKAGFPKDHPMHWSFRNGFKDAKTARAKAWENTVATGVYPTRAEALSRYSPKELSALARLERSKRSK